MRTHFFLLTLLITAPTAIDLGAATGTNRYFGDITLAATSLLAFRLREAKAKNSEGSAYRRLLLEVERSVTLGDRAHPTFTLRGNEVEVKLEFDTPRKPETLKLSFE